MKTIELSLHHVDEKLPGYGRYVLARYTGSNWKDSTDPIGCKWVVAKLVKEKNLGIRAKRNNKKPYRWDEFGPGMLWGQEVDYWMELPVFLETPKTPGEIKRIKRRKT